MSEEPHILAPLGTSDHNTVHWIPISKGILNSSNLKPKSTKYLIRLYTPCSGIDAGCILITGLSTLGRGRGVTGFSRLKGRGHYTLRDKKGVVTALLLQLEVISTFTLVCQCLLE